MDAADQAAARAIAALHARQNVIVVAGAGLSSAAGIPCFWGGSNALAARERSLLSATSYSDGATTARMHALLADIAEAADRAIPTRMHHVIGMMADQGRVRRLYTQNIDNLESRVPGLRRAGIAVPSAPASASVTVQLHGNITETACTLCPTVRPFSRVTFEGRTSAPDCDSCEGGQSRDRGDSRYRLRTLTPRTGCLRPRIVLYDEETPQSEEIGRVMASDASSRPDAVVVIGTRLRVPAAQEAVKAMCRGMNEGGVLIWINDGVGLPASLGRAAAQVEVIDVRMNCEELARRLESDWAGGSIV